MGQKKEKRSFCPQCSKIEHSKSLPNWWAGSSPSWPDIRIFAHFLPFGPNVSISSSRKETKLEIPGVVQSTDFLSVSLSFNY
jgi:hypothetical protein